MAQLIVVQDGTRYAIQCVPYNNSESSQSGRTSAELK